LREISRVHLENQFCMESAWPPKTEMAPRVGWADAQLRDYL